MRCRFAVAITFPLDSASVTTVRFSSTPSGDAAHGGLITQAASMTDAGTASWTFIAVLDAKMLLHSGLRRITIQADGVNLRHGRLSGGSQHHHPGTSMPSGASTHHWKTTMFVGALRAARHDRTVSVLTA